MGQSLPDFKALTLRAGFRLTLLPPERRVC